MTHAARVLRLVTAGLPQVMRIARRMKRRTPRADLDGLFSNGQLGLWRAAEKWDDEHRGCEGFPRFAALFETRAMVDGMRRWFRVGVGNVFRPGSVSLDEEHPAGGTRGDRLEDRRVSVEQAAEDRDTIRGYVDASVAERAKMTRRPLAMGALSPGEQATLQSAADGLTVPGTAAKTGQAKETVKRQRRDACRKLGAHGVTNAVALAWRQGLIV